MRKRGYLVLTFLLTLFFTSCGEYKSVSTAQSLDADVMWAHGNKLDTVADAKELQYQPLKLGFKNLRDIAGPNEHYFWVKIDFKLNHNLKRETLGLVFPYIHFAEKAWLNDTYIGQYGRFSDHISSALYQSHFYTLSEDSLNQNDVNTIYLLIMSQGMGTINKGIIVDSYAKAYRLSKRITYRTSTVYVMFEGALLCAAVFFFVLYMARRVNYILTFSFICVATYFFLSYFFGQELPFYGAENAGGFLFTKIVLCCGCYLTVYTIVSFMMRFIEVKQSKSWILFKHVVLIGTMVLTLAMPNYTQLMKITVPMIITYFLHFLLGFSFVVKGLFNEQTKNKSITVILAFLPLSISIIADIISRYLYGNIDNPYFAIFGWQATISIFMIYLAIEYGHVFKRNRRLTEDLKAEVELQTLDLTRAKEKLEMENIQNEREMQMASVVQQKFFPYPALEYENWEVAIRYTPLEKVSGDLFDFYDGEGRLYGLSLFDASGHGVAAALVTMLSKNLIFQIFYDAKVNRLPVSQALIDLNDQFTKAKGEVENYLTGIMIRFDNRTDGTYAELASAGHPYPIVYSAEKDDFIDLRSMEDSPHYGAIGMFGIDVAFPDIELQVKKDDIILCFSDGLTDIDNAEKKHFGRQRVMEIVRENHTKTPEELMRILSEKTEAYRGDVPLSDDITVIILKKK